jgi:zinc/manganese transport system substrate-binding protein
MLKCLLAALILALPLFGTARAAPVTIVAAENFYGDIARQIGGDRVSVGSVLANPNQDPHLFAASPSTARALADARIVIYNGVDYDPWMVKLLGASDNRTRRVIVAGDLVHRKSGDNPHIWYDPATMPIVARAVAAALIAEDPSHRGDYAGRLDQVLASLESIDGEIKGIRAGHAGASVTASEPVFGYMAAALGLMMRDTRFQLSIMNDTEPSASDVAAFEEGLRDRKAKIMFFNNQVVDPTVTRLVGIAKQAGIPIVGVSELEPPDTAYQAWMLGTLQTVDAALGPPRN